MLLSDLLQFVLLDLIIVADVVILMNRLILSPLSTVNRMLALVSSGDLSRTLLDSREGKQLLARTDEFRDTGEAISQMVASLDGIVGSIRNDAIVLSSQADGMKSSSIDIAEGANRQAASAEQVAASIEELSSIVQQAADNAKRPNPLPKVGRQGGRRQFVVQETVSAMRYRVQD